MREMKGEFNVDYPIIDLLYSIELMSEEKINIKQFMEYKKKLGKYLNNINIIDDAREFYWYIINVYTPQKALEVKKNLWEWCEDMAQWGYECDNGYYADID